MPANHTELPVIWVAQGEELIAVTTSTAQLPGWTTLASNALPQLFRGLGAPKTTGGATQQIRAFAMRDVDLEFWDKAVRKGTDGYSYGVVWGEDNKFLKNLQFKEVSSPSSVAAPPIDPVQLATAAALHQIQRTLEGIDAKLDIIQLAVERLERQHQSKQAAELLTATNALRSVGRRCIAEGEVHPEDLLRVAHLEQVVGSVLRDICHELHETAATLRFTDKKTASAALKLSSTRAADLVKLASFALEALTTYHHLLLLSKQNNNRLGTHEIELTIDELNQLANATREAVRAVTSATSKMTTRGVLYSVCTKGLVARASDKKVGEGAGRHRATLQTRVANHAERLALAQERVSSLNALTLSRRSPLRLVSSAAA